VGAVACLCTWYGLADLGVREGIPCVLGPALDRPASHGGTAQNDRLEAQQGAVLRRGGRLPQASVSPAERRATRARLRRRRQLRRKRAELLTHVQPPNRQDTLPDIGPKRAYQTHRAGGAERCAAPAVHKRLAVDLAVIDSEAQLRRALELAMGKTATPPDAHTRSGLQTVPGLGTSLRRALWSEMQDSAHFPRGQDVVSDGRLLTCAQAAAGKREGTTGTQSGQASLTWACSEAAVLCLRTPPGGHKSLTRGETQPGQGQALTVLAPKLVRAGYDMCKRGTAFERDQVLQGEGRGAGAPAAALGHPGGRRTTVLGTEPPPASANAPEPRGAVP
jgi:hypothetical protein